MQQWALRRGVIAALLGLLVAACDGTSMTAPTRTSTIESTTISTTSISPIPVTTNGLLTGPGVDDTTISLGLIGAVGADRGFGDGAALWQQAVNDSGGLCGRTVSLRPALTGEPPTGTYIRLGVSVLGFLTGTADTEQVPTTAAGDGVTVLSATGDSRVLAGAGLVPLGATEDIQIINALAFLAADGAPAVDPTPPADAPRPAAIAVLTDGSAGSANGLEGARWWAGTQNLPLVTPDPGAEPSWTGVRIAVVLSGPAAVRAALLSAPSTVDVITTIDGWDPAQVPAEDAGRLFVALPTPPFGSDQPAAAAVTRAYQAAHPGTAPGPRVLTGYAVAAGWGRLINQACADGALTRAGVATALTTVGPASVDSLFGTSDPALVVDSELPATRVSSVALTDPARAGGLAPLQWLQAAPGIDDYQPQHAR